MTEDGVTVFFLITVVDFCRFTLWRDKAAETDWFALVFSCCLKATSLVLPDAACPFPAVAGRSLVTGSCCLLAAACEPDFTNTGVVAGQSWVGAASFPVKPEPCLALSSSLRFSAMVCLC